MNTVTGFVLSTVSGKSINISRDSVSNLDLKLMDLDWEVGIDAGSKFTGLAISDTDRRYIILLDIARDLKVPKEKYFDDLYYLLKRTFYHHKVSLVVNEKPFTQGYVRASEVLIALRGKVDSWMREIPELAEAEYNLILPQSWKAQIIDKSKGKNRFNAPGAIADDLCDMYPGLRMYRELPRPGDLDSFDALGVLLGYKKKTYTDSGMKRISGLMEKSHNSFVVYDWVHEDELDEQYLSKCYGEAVKIFNPVCLVYNEDYSLNENVKLASSNNDCVFTIVPQKLLQQFQWKFGININEPNHRLVMFVFRKGHFSPSLMTWLKDNFSMYEEVGPL